MKKIGLFITLFLTLNANAMDISVADTSRADSTYTVVDFTQLSQLFYKSASPEIKIKFGKDYQGYRIVLDNDTTQLYTDAAVVLSDLKRGDHTLTIFKETGDQTDVHSKTFKIKNRPPLITNDATVFGILMFVLFLIFRTARMKSFRKFYRIVPALLLCYFIPAGLNSLGIISSAESDLYYMASRYLLPASLVLLCLSIDLKGIMKLGSKAITMFFAATIGIVVGGPLALWLVSLFAPEVLNDEIWRGLSTVAGSWIGGGANQTAMKEIYGASDQLFSAMIVVDVFVANIFMSILLFGTGFDKKINKFLKADDSAIEGLKKKMEDFQASISKVATFNDIVFMMGVAFFSVGMSHLIADYLGPAIYDYLQLLKETSPNAANLMASFGSQFFWLVVFATIFGILLSFTRFKSLEGAGASKMGSLFLYILVATIGMKMDIGELIANWGIFKFLISIGLIWIAVHALFLFVVAKLIKAPFFYVAVGSQANVGGAASAPIVASAFSPSLAPVGVLLAVLGYAVGTFAAILCTLLMQSLTL
ncbi:MAG: DUF819 family protein [Crocinitomicaceae bacterium]